jgi:hypothetical protein
MVTDGSFDNSPAVASRADILEQIGVIERVQINGWGTGSRGKIYPCFDVIKVSGLFFYMVGRRLAR